MYDGSVGATVTSGVDVRGDETSRIESREGWYRHATSINPKR